MSDNLDREAVRGSLRRLWDYCLGEDLRGYDKFDALNSPLLRGASLGIPLLRAVFSQVVVRSPFSFDVRPFLLVRKDRGPSRVAHFTSACAIMDRLEPGAGWRERAAGNLEWLLEHSLPGYSGRAWGYPFPWQNWGFYAPPGMANLVVTRYCGDALLDVHELTREPRWLEAARSAADFMLRDLPALVESADELCLSYVPVRARIRVINVNAQAGAFLSRLAAATGEKDLAVAARRLLTYVVRRKTPDHAWYYSDPPMSRSLVRHDNYHTAHNIDALLSYARTSGDDSFMGDYRAGLGFYRRELFLDDGAPKRMSDKVYPLDTRGAAAGIVTFSEAAAHDPSCGEFAWRVASWAIRSMQDPRGFFRYQIARKRVKRYTLMGWCNASMAHALATLLHNSQPAEGVPK